MLELIISIDAMSILTACVYTVNRYIRLQRMVRQQEHQSIRNHNLAIEKEQNRHAEEMARIEKMGVLSVRRAVNKVHDYFDD